MLRILSVGALAVLMLLPAACSDKKSTGAAALTTANQKTYPRAEFEKMVIGKTEREVIAAVGDARAKTGDAGNQVWRYGGITTGDNNAVDGMTKLTFANGKVAKVEYGKSGEE
jgi:hypothetical protein